MDILVVDVRVEEHDDPVELSALSVRCPPSAGAPNSDTVPERPDTSSRPGVRPRHTPPYNRMDTHTRAHPHMQSLTHRHVTHIDYRTNLTTFR